MSLAESFALMSTNQTANHEASSTTYKHNPPSTNYRAALPFP